MTYKSYYHPVINSTFIVQRGPGQADVLTFNGGHLAVDESDTEAIKQLDAIADKAGSFVTTKGVAPMTDAVRAAAVVRSIAEATVDKLQHKVQAA